MLINALFFILKVMLLFKIKNIKFIHSPGKGYFFMVISNMDFYSFKTIQLRTC